MAGSLVIFFFKVHQEPENKNAAQASGGEFREIIFGTRVPHIEPESLKAPWRSPARLPDPDSSEPLLMLKRE
jgi:hypothetical protein